MDGLPSANGESTYGEPSWDRTTPFTTGGDIPIDPALSEPPLDPVLMEEDGVSGDMEVSAFWLRIKMFLVHDAEVAERVASRSCLHTARGSPKSHLLSRQTQQSPPLYDPLHPPRVELYLQGPQGDPFPEPLPLYVPVQEEIPTHAKPLKKRKRPLARESACQFCKSHKSDKDGNPEQIVSCKDCGISGKLPTLLGWIVHRIFTLLVGHPSCMGLRDVINSYDWQCHGCKSCSACFSQDSEVRFRVSTVARGVCIVDTTLGLHAHMRLL